jgi:hypothetical protein
MLSALVLGRRNPAPGDAAASANSGIFTPPWAREFD